MLIYQCVQPFLVNTFAQYTESCRGLQEKIRANVHGFSAKGTGFRGVQNTEEYGSSIAFESFDYVISVSDKAVFRKGRKWEKHLQIQFFM